VRFCFRTLVSVQGLYRPVCEQHLVLFSYLISRIVLGRKLLRNSEVLVLKVMGMPFDWDLVVTDVVSWSMRCSYDFESEGWYSSSARIRIKRLSRRSLRLFFRGVNPSLDLASSEPPLPLIPASNLTACSCTCSMSTAAF